MASPLKPMDITSDVCDKYSYILLEWQPCTAVIYKHTNPMALRHRDASELRSAKHYILWTPITSSCLYYQDRAFLPCLGYGGATCGYVLGSQYFPPMAMSIHFYLRI